MYYVYIDCRQLESTVKLKDPQLLIVATTHLKSSRSATGERYREKEINQIMERISKIKEALAVSSNQEPVVLLAGSFNAVPEPTIYAPLTYRAIKSHPLELRSVYNDDLGSANVFDIYTTWKIKKRCDSNTEVLTKRCSDYILYSPFKKFEFGGAISLPLVEVIYPRQHFLDYFERLT